MTSVSPPPLDDVVVLLEHTRRRMLGRAAWVAATTTIGGAALGATMAPALALAFGGLGALLGLGGFRAAHGAYAWDHEEVPIERVARLFAARHEPDEGLPGFTTTEERVTGDGWQAARVKTVRFEGLWLTMPWPGEAPPPPPPDGVAVEVREGRLHATIARKPLAAPSLLRPLTAPGPLTAWVADWTRLLAYGEAVTAASR